MALRKRRSFQGKSALHRMLNALLPSRARRLPLSRKNMAGMGPVFFRHLMKSVSNVDDLVAVAKDCGVHLIACAMSMDVMGIQPDELVDGIEIGRAAACVGDLLTSDSGFPRLMIEPSPRSLRLRVVFDGAKSPVSHPAQVPLPVHDVRASRGRRHRGEHDLSLPMRPDTEQEQLRERIKRLEAALCAAAAEPESRRGEDARAALDAAERHVELERQGAELKAALEKARVAVRRKDEFIAKVSHELRTPLNAVLGMGELLADTELTSLQLDLVRTTSAAGRSLRELIDDLLDFSRIDATQARIECAPIDCWEICEEAVALLRFRPPRRGSPLTLGSRARLRAS